MVTMHAIGLDSSTSGVRVTLGFTVTDRLYWQLHRNDSSYSSGKHNGCFVWSRCGVQSTSDASKTVCMDSVAHVFLGIPVGYQEREDLLVHGDAAGMLEQWCLKCRSGQGEGHGGCAG